MFPGGADSEIVDEARVTALMQNFTRAFRETVPQVFAEFGEEKAKEFVDELKFKISAQLFNHIPLQRDYYLSKLRNGLDPRILIATGEYLDKITYERVEDDTSGVVFRCGMAPGIHGSSGLQLAALQRMLEEGTSRMPARPHWHPMATIFRARSNEMGRDLRGRLATRVRASL